MSIVAALDILAGQLQAVFPETLVTRDPGSVRPPCLHVGLPSGIGSALAGGLSMEVPVYVVGTQPGDQAGMDPVLNMLPDLMRALGVNQTQPVTLQLSEQTTYPAYRVNARIKTKEGTP